MGTSTSPAQCAAKFGRLAQAFDRLPRDGVLAASLVVKDDTQREMRRAVGSDLRMSGVGTRGARIGTTFNIKGGNNPTSLVRAFGPAHLVESGTKAHTITPRRRRGKRGLAIPGVGVRARVQHPGSPAKHPWRKGVATAVPKTRAAFGKAFHLTLAKVFT